MDSTMPIDPARLKQLREQRAWSQEHLAALTGLSVRTIQRLETTGAAAHESRLALAAVFGLDPADLSPPSAEIDTSPPSAPTPVAAIPNRSPRSRRVVPLLAVSGGLLAFDLWHHHAITWSKWPLLGIAIALALRFLRHRYHARNCTPP